MPFIDFTTSPETSVPAPEKEVTETKPAPTAPVTKSPEPKVTKSADDQRILEFKTYLQSLRLYSGDVNNPEADQQFVTALKQIEQTIASAIENNAAIGLIWQGSRVNPQTSVEDVENALRLIAKKKLTKGAQATVDTFDTEEYQENPPLATKQNLTQDDSGIQTGDPDESQQQGRMKQEIPPRLSSVDDRLVAFTRLLYNYSE